MSVTLHYFDNYGPGELTRMILHSQGIEFTDDRLTEETFQTFKATGLAEFGEVPCLEIDGKALVQSRAIERYLFLRSGINPSTPYEVYLNDSTINFIDDVRTLMIKALYSEKGMEGMTEFIQNEFPVYLRMLNKRVNEHHFFVNDRAQHADWVVFDTIWSCFLMPGYGEKNRALLESNAPKVLVFAENFKSRDERLSAYMAARPDGKC